MAAGFVGSRRRRPLRRQHRAVTDLVACAHRPPSLHSLPRGGRDDSATFTRRAGSKIRACGGVAAIASEVRHDTGAVERLTRGNLDHLAANLDDETREVCAAVDALSEAMQKGVAAAEGKLAS